MEIKVKQQNTGQIYSSNMSDVNQHKIVNISFCTSYTCVHVQTKEGGETTFHDIILPPFGVGGGWLNSLGQAIDLIATQDDPRGEWVLN
jgi:hypothetical protein